MAERKFLWTPHRCPECDQVYDLPDHKTFNCGECLARHGKIVPLAPDPREAARATTEAARRERYGEVRPPPIFPGDLAAIDETS